MNQNRILIAGSFLLLLLRTTLAAELDVEQARQYWAFRQPISPTIPEVAHSDSTRTPIDAFVLARLEANELDFSPAADRRTLLRRVYLDVIGLPPEPEEVIAFLAENSPDAYQRVLDRLLASPHFGERWAPHWLDPAGFIPHGESSRWRYREYVVRSFNQDKPYDRFLIEQLAGDELVDWRTADSITPEIQELLVATGFLRTANDLTGNVMTDIPSYRYSTLFDTLEIFGTSVLGLTLQCARCHTHKYDPIPQRDYFRLMALFTPAYNPEKWIRVQDRMAPGEIVALYDVGPPPKTHLLNRGDINIPTDEVQPGFLRVFCETNADALADKIPEQKQGDTSGRRLALAHWLTKPMTPVNGLVNRVLVNRVWHHLFGRGIVATPGNLGRSGAAPTHPELVDYLATDFVRGGSRLKLLVRQLLTASVYRQATTRWSGKSPTDLAATDLLTKDAENRFLWRMRLRRMDSEIIRDAILAISGKLDRTPGGSGVLLKNLPEGQIVVDTEKMPTPTSHWRRSIYLGAPRVDGTTWSQPNVSLLSVFDQPIIMTNCTQRKSSAVVLQSLTMMNDTFVLEQAQHFAERIAKSAGAEEADRVRLAFQIALTRPPTPDESAWSAEFLKLQVDNYEVLSLPTAAVELKALASLCHALLNSNSFLYIE